GRARLRHQGLARGGSGARGPRGTGRAALRVGRDRHHRRLEPVVFPFGPSIGLAPICQFCRTFLQLFAVLCLRGTPYRCAQQAGPRTWNSFPLLRRAPDALASVPPRLSTGSTTFFASTSTSRFTWRSSATSL